MFSFLIRFITAFTLTLALCGCSTYVSQVEGQAFEPVDPAIKALSLRILYYNSLKLKKNYLCENWKLLLAFFLPGFFLSTALESLVVNFSVFRVDLKFSSNITKAFDIPCTIAPA